MARRGRFVPACCWRRDGRRALLLAACEHHRAARRRAGGRALQSRAAPSGALHQRTWRRWMWRCRRVRTGLSPDQHVDVYRFLQRYKREANGRLVIAVPGAPARSSVDGAIAAGHPAPRGRGRHRLPPDARHAPGRRRRFRVIRIAYQRPVAVPPTCDKWGENVGRNEARIPYPEFRLCHAAQHSP